MEVHKGIIDFSVDASVVTVGMFDGLHMGHRQLIGELVMKAREKGLPSVVVTFWPHPKVVLTGDYGHIKLLSTLDEKIELISELGVDHLVIMEFTKRLADMTAQRFVKEVLIGRLNARHFVIGYNHHFGSSKQTTEEEVEICRSEGLECTVGGQYVSEKYGQCSSSEIRTYLSVGDMGAVGELLGRRYSLCGTVIHGDGIGQKIGFPTANIDVGDRYKMMPGDGVYAALANFDGTWRQAVVDIGTRPTVGGETHRVEAHLIDFSSKIYGRIMELSFCSRIRDEKRFSMLEELESQIVKDVAEARMRLENYS